MTVKAPGLVPGTAAFPPAAPVAPQPEAAYPSGSSASAGTPRQRQAPGRTAPIPARAGSAPAEAAAPQTEESDTYDVRGMVADLLLKQADEYRRSNPNDVFSYREKLESLRRTHDGTQAAAEAARLLGELRLPELPPERNPSLLPPEAWASAEPLLRLVDPDRDALQGRWTVERGRLRSDRSTWAKLALPYLLPEEYDVRVVFERGENHDCLLAILWRRGRPFLFSIGGAGNRGCSFEDVRESGPDVLPTKIVRTGVLSSHKVHEVIVLVRSKCLRAFLDGAPIVGCQVDDEGLSLRSEFVPHARGSSHSRPGTASTSSFPAT